MACPQCGVPIAWEPKAYAWWTRGRLLALIAMAPNFIWAYLITHLRYPGVPAVNWSAQLLPIYAVFSLTIILFAASFGIGMFGMWRLHLIIPESEFRPCPKCNYDLRGNTGPLCPECGAAVIGIDLQKPDGNATATGGIT